VHPFPAWDIDWNPVATRRGAIVWHDTDAKRDSPV